MWLGCRRRGGRAHVALAAPMVAVRMLPLLYLVTEWTPMRYALHDRSKFLLWYGGLLAAGTVASALFALLLARHARAVEIRPRVLEASAGLRGHADAVVARVVVLVGAAVLGVMAALGKSLAMVKVVMVIGPLGGVAAGAFVVLGAARFARASVSARLWAHCAAVLLLAGVVIDTQVLALMLGLFWGRGDLLDRLQHIMRWSPSIELCGQLVGAAALICMLVALAEVGRERAVREAGSRAFGIGAGLGVLVLCGALLRHYLPALAAGGGGLLTLGVGLLAAAIWLFVAYLGLVRDTARALAAPEAPPLLS